MLNRAPTPFLGRQRRKSTSPLRPGDPKSYQNTFPGTTTPRSRVTLMSRQYEVVPAALRREPHFETEPPSSFETAAVFEDECARR
eukprot:3507719-Pyramimonas_sp.AAC.1